MAPRTLFEKFGHQCEISNFRNENIFDKKRTIFFSLRVFFDRIRVISETSSIGYNFVRSQKKMESERRRILERRFIIHPFSDFKLFWNVFISIVMVFQFILVPLDIAFCSFKVDNNFVLSRSFITVRLLTNALSFLDLIVTFFCGYCDNKGNVIVINPSEIAKHYLTGRFLLDLFSSFPLDVLLNWYDSSLKTGQRKTVFFFLHYMGLITVGRYYFFVKYMVQIFERSEKSFIIHRIVIAFVTFFIWLHVVTCCSIAWTSYQLTWTIKILKTHIYSDIFGTRSLTTGSLYASFFYFSCLMVLNATFGVLCYTDETYMFVTSMWIVSRIMYIFTLAYFMQLHMVVMSSSQKFIDMQNEVKDYMRHRQIPDFLQKRIISYYDIKFQNCYFQESEILNTVSGQLRQEIIMNTCRKLVESVTFFKDLPLVVLVRIVSCLKYDIFLTNDIIAKVGTPGNSMYFISNGTVAIYSKTGKEVCHLHDGDYFGEIALILKDAVRVASVIAAEVCELYSLDRADFVKAILPFPDLYEKIAYLASERLERTFIADETNKVNATTNPKAAPLFTISGLGVTKSISRIKNVRAPVF